MHLLKKSFLILLYLCSAGERGGKCYVNIAFENDRKQVVKWMDG